MQFLIKYIKPYNGRMSLGIFFKFIGTLMDLMLPYFLAYIIDTITPMRSIRLVVLYGFIMLGCALMALLMNIIANRMASAVARDSTRKIRYDLYEKISYLSNRQIDSFTIPSLISRMTTDTYNIHRMIGMMQRIGIRAPILIVGGIAVTMTLDPVLSALLCCMLPLILVMVFSISGKSLPLFDKLQIAIDDMVRVVRESIIGIRVIKALGRTEDEKEHFSEKNKKVVADETKANVIIASVNPLMNLILNTGLVLVILIGAYRVNSGLSEVGKIIAFLSYFTIILNAMMAVTRIITMYTKALASANRINEVLMSSSEIVRLQAEEREDASGEKIPFIHFDNVTFSYNKVTNDLENISFTLERGESLGIIGPTGAGKSTIIALLMRLYDPDSGNIYINGKDIREYDPGELRCLFGVVFQNDTVFNDTLWNNITLGRQISLREVDRAADCAQASEFIAERAGLEEKKNSSREEEKKGHFKFRFFRNFAKTEPEVKRENEAVRHGGGYDYEAAIGGANLSGGQKQRLLIARALAGNPEILILDDSSSALDYKTDARMRYDLGKNYSDTTTVLVAQRISSVMHCSRILAIEDGKITGYGTHRELMESCPMYKEIAEIQLG